MTPVRSFQNLRNKVACGMAHSRQAEQFFNEHVLNITSTCHFGRLTRKYERG